MVIYKNKWFRVETMGLKPSTEKEGSKRKRGQKEKEIRRDVLRCLGPKPDLVALAAT